MREGRDISFDYEVDVLVAGSGSGGLTAAATTSSQGLKTLVLESTELIGGCSAMSGGGAWIPNNPPMKKAGYKDSFDSARTYMDETIEYTGLASSIVRRDAYVREGVNMVDYLTSIGMEFAYTEGYPDYYPNLPGGLDYGRAIEGELYDIKNLPEQWQGKLRSLLPLAMRTLDACAIQKTFSRKGISRLMTIGFKRLLGGKIRGKNYVGMGVALVGRLLEISLKNGCEIWIDSPLKELIIENDAVVGAVVENEGVPKRIRANKGVVIAAGGFARNQEMRDKYQEPPVNANWSVSSPGDMGTGILAGIAAGAQTELMDDAWWGPVTMPTSKKASFIIWERSDPFSIIVDAEGKRFMNESTSYVDCGHIMYEHNKEVPCIPAWIIFDKRHRDRYMFSMNPPKMTSKSALESGFIIKSASLPELADKTGLSLKNLTETINRFNGFCKTGRDEDFHRGDFAYDRLYSDAAVKPNPCLGFIAKPPFYACKVYPGDLSTKGGLLADEHSRVLRSNGSIIKGLYATGNSSASVMGRTYPGPGATIGAAMTFAYVAGKHIAESSAS